MVICDIAKKKPPKRISTAIAIPLIIHVSYEFQSALITIQYLLVKTNRKSIAKDDQQCVKHLLKNRGNCNIQIIALSAKTKEK